MRQHVEPRECCWCQEKPRKYRFLRRRIEVPAWWCLVMVIVCVEDLWRVL